jgi:hypothetical protein
MRIEVGVQVTLTDVMKDCGGFVLPALPPELHPDNVVRISAADSRAANLHPIRKDLLRRSVSATYTPPGILNQIVL